MRLGVLHHAVDFVVGKRGGAGDRDLLLLARAQILSGNVHDAVRVDVEGDFDLRNAATSSRDARELEAAKRLVVVRHLALALQDVDFHGRLVVGGGGVDLGLAGRDGGVAVDHLGHDAAHGLNAQGQRGNIEKQDALDVASEHAALNSRAHSNDLVRVHRHVRLLTRHALHELLNGRHTSGAADEDDLVDVALGHARVAQRLLNRLAAAIEQILGDALELRAGERVVQMLRAGGVSRDEGQVDVCLRGGGELHLRLLRRFLQTLQRHLVLAQVDAAVVGRELVGQPIDDAVIPVVAAELVVASGCSNLEDAVAELQDGHVEGAAAEVEHEDLLVLVGLIEAVSQGGCRRLVDDAEHFEAGDLASVLRRLALRIVEVRGHGDDGLGDGAADLLLRVGLQLLEHHCRDFLGSVGLALDVDDRTAVLARLDLVAHLGLLSLRLVEGAADETLDGRNRVLRVGDCLVLCGLTDDALAVLAEALDRRGGAIAFGVHEDLRLAAFHDCHCRVRGAQVNTENLRHYVSSPL